MNEKEIISVILNIITNRKESLDSRTSNGRRVLDNIRSDLVTFAFMSHSFDITLVYVKVSLVTNLLNNFFEKRIQRLASQGILSAKYELSPTLKEMLTREMGSLDVGKHFDADYVVLFGKLKEDLTTLKNLDTADEISKTATLNKVSNVIFDLINDSSREIIKEIDEKVGLLVSELTQALENAPSFPTLNKEIDAFIAKMHKELYGWP